MSSRTKTIVGGFALASELAWVSACGGGDAAAPTRPEPLKPQTNGAVAVSFVSSTPGTAALRVRIAGQGITSIDVAGDVTILARMDSSEAFALLLSVPIDAGKLLSVKLSDVSKLPTVTVLEATSGRSNGYRAQDPRSMTITVARE